MIRLSPTGLSRHSFLVRVPRARDSFLRADGTRPTPPAPHAYRRGRVITLDGLQVRHRGGGGNHRLLCTSTSEWLAAACHGPDRKGTSGDGGGRLNRIATHPEPATETIEPPPVLMVVPFVLMLGCDRRHARPAWGKALVGQQPASVLRRRRLGAVTILYYAVAHHFPIIGHFPAKHISDVSESELVHLGTVGDVLANAILTEYVPFIVSRCACTRSAAAFASRGTCLPIHSPIRPSWRSGRSWRTSSARPGQRGLDPAAAGNQSRAETRRPYCRRLHLHRLELRWVPVAAGRSAAVLRLSARRPVPVAGSRAGNHICCSPSAISDR